MKKNAYLRIPTLIIILISFFIFRNLIQPKLIGHTWDWGLPAFREQYLIRLQSFLYIWNDKILTGYYSGFTSELPYWILLSLLSMFFGAYTSAAIVTFIFVLSGISMYFVVRKLTGINPLASLISALIFTYNPFTYSRLIAGHLTILLAYAFLPMFFLFMYKYLRDNHRRFFIASVLVTLILSIHSTVLVLAMYSSIVLAIYFLFVVGWRRTIKSVFFLTVTSILINIYWIFPLVYSFWRFGDVTLRASGTVSSEFAEKLNYLSSLSQPIFKLLTFSIDTGMHTEFIYPVNSVLSLFKISSIVLFSSVIFILAGYHKKKSGYLIPLIIIDILGIALSSGTKNIIGIGFFKILERLAPYVNALFTNALRHLPLMLLVTSIFFGVTINHFLENTRKSFRFLIISLALIIVFIFQIPWFFSDFTRPKVKGNQPLALKLIKINDIESKIINDFRRESSDTRVVLFPPAFVSWPGETDFGLLWSTLFFPKSTFLNYHYHPLSEIILERLYSSKQDSDLSKLFGFASVKSIIYPDYQKFESYVVYIPGTVDYKPYVDRNLIKQTNLQKKTDKYLNVTILENKNVLPHFYVPKRVLVYSGNANSVIADAVSVPDYDIQSVFIKDSDTNLNQFHLDSNSIIQPVCAGCKSIILPEYEKFPKIKLLPTSFLYNQIIRRENQNLESLNKYPYAQAKLMLIYGNKRLIEIKQMMDEKTDIEPNSVQSIVEFTRLFQSAKSIIRGMSKQMYENNENLIELQELLSFQAKELGNIILTTRNGDLSQVARNQRDLIVELSSELKSSIVKPNDSTYTYFVNIPKQSVYELNYYDIVNSGLLKIWFDNKKIDFSGETMDKWTKVNLSSLPTGYHKLKLQYQVQPNLHQESQIILNAADIPTTRNIPISDLDDRYFYNLYFEYQLSGSPVKMTLVQNNDQNIDGKISRKLDIFLNQVQEWGIINQDFTPNFGSSQAQLQFQFNSQSNDTKLNTLTIKNTRISKIDKPNFFISSQKFPDNQETPIITFTKVNPTKYRVLVKSALNPFLLVFSESYLPDWKAYVVNSIPKKGPGQTNIRSYLNDTVFELPYPSPEFDWNLFETRGYTPVSENNHFRVNSYANSWYIDQTGDFSMIIEFVPQKYYVITLILSAISLIMLIVIGGISTFKLSI